MANRGFTLIEMMVALGVAALLAGLAAPGLGNFLRDCRLAVTTQSLLQAIHTARRLAGVQGQPVELCPSMDGRGCIGGTDWSGSLLLRAASDDGPPLRVLSLATDGHAQSVRSNRSVLRFAPLAPSATTTTLVVCDDRGASAARAIIVSRGGRPRIAQLDASGRPLVCP